MLNLAFIIYLLLVAVFVGGVLAVIYHLYAYRMNNGFSAFMMVLFLCVSIVLLLINIGIADKMNWSSFSFLLPFL